MAEALGIISTMNGIRSPVVTFCRGSIGAEAAVIAAHGLKGFRTADPGAHFSLKMQSGYSGNGTLEAYESYLKLLAQIFANDVARSETEVLQWLTDGAEFSPQEAMRHGLIDAIARQPLLPKVP